MRKNVLSFVLTSMLMSICVPMRAQQPQSSVDSIPPGFNRAYFDETASAEEIVRRNPDMLKFNENGVWMINGRELDKLVVNGKVLYSQDDTIKDPVRLLEEIGRRIRENTAPLEPVIAHIDDRELLSDSLLSSLQSPYSLPEGESLEDVVRKLPGVEILEDGSVTVNGKRISRILFDDPDFRIQDTTVTQDVMDKVNQYENSKKYQRQARRASKKEAGKQQ